MQPQVWSPSPLWQAGSAATLAAFGMFSRLFLFTYTRKLEIEGIDDFGGFLDEWKKEGEKRRGLITVSNHISVIDDPLIWGALPFRYMFSPSNLRWSLGSHDICFTGPIRSLLFSLGQTLPTYRLHKSPLGGLFQPTIESCISLLSGTFPHPPSSPPSTPPLPPQWIHVFPEGRVHQHPTYQLRYFKWGISRLFLESSSYSSQKPPTILPIFFTGADKMMHESRTFPRFLPRVYKDVKITFGPPIPDQTTLPLHAEYQKLSHSLSHQKEKLMHHPVAVDLRVRTARMIRDAVNELRRKDGRWPDEDENAGDPETYKFVGKKEGEVHRGVLEREAS